MSAPDIDVAIVGAGPCGLAAGIALQQAKFRAEVFDKSCLVSSISAYPIYVTFFSSPEKLAIGGVPFPVAGKKPTRREGLAYYRRVAEHYHVSLRLFEAVVHITRTGTDFVVHSQQRDGDSLETHAKAVVIATGYFSSPNMLGVPGENLPHVTHQFVEGHDAFGESAVVVGGGNSAVECALDLVRCGARPTVVHFGESFNHMIKPWILPEFEKLVASGAIRMRWNARVVAIEKARVRVATTRGEEWIPARRVYLMTGYTPEPGLLGELGVPFDATTGVPRHNPATMETSVPNVFVAGVIASGNDANSVFIENGRDHGALIARALSARRGSR